MKTNILAIAFLLCFSCPINAQEPKPSPNPQQASGGGGAAADSAFRLVRSVSGTKLVQETGRYGVEDPRTVFYVPADKEIIVYFTWEGPPGPHRFEGMWKNPSGRVTMTSEFDYTPNQRRFGGYFKMMPGDTPPTGVWTLEARIDGETAGSHAFEISTAPRPENAKPARRLIPPSEIYSRAAAASVFVENINAKNVRRNVGTGFFIAPGKLLTAFQVIEGAAKVRVLGPQAKVIEVTEVHAFNRRQDWVILNVALENMPSLERESATGAAVGERSYFLDVPAEGNRVLVETSLIGKQDLGPAGDRLNISDNVNRRAVGSPLFNEYGEVLGLIGGSLVPGVAFIEDLAQGVRPNSFGVAQRGTLAVPISLVNDSASNVTTIDGLLRDGQFMPALVNTQSVLTGVMARSVNKKTDPPQPIEERIEFSRANAQGVLLVTWLPKEKRKGYPALRVYNLDNRLISETVNKKKITVTPNKLSYSQWDLNFAPLQPGIYRVDVLLDGDFVWRAFFRMVE